jgi:hypothetical protein
MGKGILALLHSRYLNQIFYYFSSEFILLIAVLTSKAFTKLRIRTYPCILINDSIMNFP